MPRYCHPLLAIVLLSTLLLTACGSSDDKNAYTLTELNEAIEHRFPEYEWPPNFNISADTINENIEIPLGSYIEIPGEYTFLGTYHTCAWEITLLTAVSANNRQLIDQSIIQLVEFGQNHNPIESDEHGKAAKKTMYNNAIAGDSADLQSWVTNNCGFVKPYFTNSQRPGNDLKARLNLDSGGVGVIQFRT